MITPALLPEGWPEPSAESRPWTRWWWLGAAIEDDVLRGLLAEYAAAGLGGVEIQSIYAVNEPTVPERAFLTPEWVAALDVAAEAAEGLGLGLDLTCGSGWPFGGPWIGADDSARRMITQRFTVAEGGPLPTLISLQASFSGQAYSNHNYGAVGAHRAPGAESEHGVPVIEGVDDHRLLERVVVRDRNGQVLDLTAEVSGEVDHEGIAMPTAPAGGWEGLVVWSGLVGMLVKRAAPGSEGLVIDYFSPTSLSRYLEAFQQALGNERHGIRAMFHDSYEVETADWGSGVLEAFAELRGYDLTPYLFALAGEGDRDLVARVRCDFRETLGDLLLARFTSHWSDWNAEHGWLTRNQAHGSPGNLLDLYGRVDIPETETYGPSGLPIPGLREDPTYPLDHGGRPDPLMMKVAASAGHVMGRRLIAAEACTWLAEHWKVSAAQMKAELDQLWVSGINHVIYHGTTYSDPQQPWPGLTFYASTDLSPANPLWQDLPALNAYGTRVQSVLQSGDHDHDVLLYLGFHDIWQQVGDPILQQLSVHTAAHWLHGHPSGVGEIAAELVAHGWQADFLSDQMIMATTVVDGRLQTPGGSYAVMVVPPVRALQPETAEHLVGLVRDGAQVIVLDRWPTTVPGLADQEVRERRLAAAGGELAGAVLERGSLHQALAAAGARREPAVDHGLRVIRRADGDVSYRFVVNQTAEPVAAWVGLGDTVGTAEVCDAVTGRTWSAALRTGKLDQPGDHDQPSEVWLELAPGATVLLRSIAIDRAGTSTDTAIPASASPPERSTVAVVPLDGTWTLRLNGGPGQVEPRDLGAGPLGSWTAHDAAAEAYVGTGTYSSEFDLTADILDQAEIWRLDLGAVAESAQVMINNVAVGHAWSLPYRLWIDREVLRPGVNTIMITVTNAAANRIRTLAQAGEWSDPSFMVSIRYQAFRPESWDVMPSGLLGPVSLVGLSGPASSR